MAWPVKSSRKFIISKYFLFIFIRVCVSFEKLTRALCLGETSQPLCPTAVLFIIFLGYWTVQDSLPAGWRSGVVRASGMNMCAVGWTCVHWDEHVCVRFPASLMRQILWQGHMTIQRLKTLLGKKEAIGGLILTTYYMIRPYHALCTAQNWKSHRANLMDIDSICGPTKINHHFNPHKSNFLKLTFLTLRKSHFFWTNPSCLKPSSFNYHINLPSWFWTDRLVKGMDVISSFAWKPQTLIYNMLADDQATQELQR